MNRFLRALTIVATAACLYAPFASAATAGAHVVRTTVTLHGSPFFPIMGLDLCDTQAASSAARLGIDVVVDERCTSAGAADDTQVVVLPMAHRGARGARIAGFTYPDEPENNGWTPARLVQSFGGGPTADGTISVITTTSGFFRPPYRNLAVPRQETRTLTRLADLAGFDLYPLNHCQHDLAAVYEAQRAFAQLAGRRPTFQWIEATALKPSYCGGLRLTAAEVQAEAWLTVAGGARGIGFFTGTLEPPRAFDVSPAVAGAIARFARTVHAVQPGVLGRAAAARADSGAIEVAARTGTDGATYVFAVNTLTTPVQAQLHVPRLHDGAVQVFGEGRRVTAGGDNIGDMFRPLAVHVYVQR